MKDVSEWSVPKWPFLVGFGVLLGAAYYVVDSAGRHPGNWPELAAAGLVALGAILGVLPFILEYRAASKLVEMNLLTGVTEELKNLEHYAAQVTTATDQWQRLQDVGQTSAAKTAASAAEIADRMTHEVRNFNEFQAKLNDHEKQMLRLEVDKLRRVEGDWLQVCVRILDHVYALHIAAVRSGQPEIAAQIGQFQNACREATRRVGLIPFSAEPGEPFSPLRHRAHGIENPAEGEIIAETLAQGVQFQGRLIRPALVRLQTAEGAAPAIEPASTPARESHEPTHEPAHEPGTREPVVHADNPPATPVQSEPQPAAAAASAAETAPVADPVPQPVAAVVAPEPTPAPELIPTAPSAADNSSAPSGESAGPVETPRRKRRAPAKPESLELLPEPAASAPQPEVPAPKPEASGQMRDLLDL